MVDNLIPNPSSLNVGTEAANTLLPAILWPTGPPGPAGGAQQKIVPVRKYRWESWGGGAEAHTWCLSSSDLDAFILFSRNVIVSLKHPQE